MSARSRCKTASPLLGALLHPLTLLLLLSAVGCTLLVRSGALEQPAVDPMTQCLTMPTAMTAVLLDVTDPLPDYKRRGIEIGVEEVLRKLPQGGKISLYLLAQGAVGQENATACNPGDGSDGVRLTSTPEVKLLLWQENFRDKLLAAFKEAQNANDSNSSKILEAVGAVSMQAFGTPCSAPDSPKRLVIISDMLQKTPGLDQYRNRRPVEYREFATTDYYNSVRPYGLRDVDVEIFYVRRTEHARRQGEAHKVFWSELLTACGAKSVTFREI